MVAGEIGLAVQAVGATIRFHGSLSATARELAILLVARHRRARFEWFAHVPIARRVGLSDAVVEAVRRGDVPTPVDEDLAVTHDVVVELLRTGRLAEPTFDRATAMFGEQRLVELVLVVGYYGLLADVLNGFAVGAPGADPFSQRAAADGEP